MTWPAWIYIDPHECEKYLDQRYHLVVVHEQIEHSPQALRLNWANEGAFLCCCYRIWDQPQLFSSWPWELPCISGVRKFLLCHLNYQTLYTLKGNASMSAYLLIIETILNRFQGFAFTCITLTHKFQ